MPFTVQGVRGNCITIFQPRDHKFSSIKKDLLDIRRDAYIEHRRASYIATCGEFGVAIFRMWRYLAWHHARIPTLGMLTSSWPESGTQHFLRERFDKTCRSVCSWWTTVSLSCFAMGYEYLLEFTGQNLGSSPLWPIYLPPCPLAWTLQTQNKLSNKKITGPWNKSRATWDSHKSHKVFFQYLGLLSDAHGFSRIFLPSTQPILFSRTPSFACSAMADGRFNESTSLRVYEPYQAKMPAVQRER